MSSQRSGSKSGAAAAAASIHSPSSAYTTPSKQPSSSSADVTSTTPMSKGKPKSLAFAFASASTASPSSTPHTLSTPPSTLTLQLERVSRTAFASPLLNEDVIVLSPQHFSTLCARAGDFLLITLPASNRCFIARAWPNKTILVNACRVQLEGVDDSMVNARPPGEGPHRQLRDPHERSPSQAARAGPHLGLYPSGRTGRELATRPER